MNKAASPFSPTKMETTGKRVKKPVQEERNITITNVKHESPKKSPPKSEIKASPVKSVMKAIFKAWKEDVVMVENEPRGRSEKRTPKVKATKPVRASPIKAALETAKP